MTLTTSEKLSLLRDRKQYLHLTAYACDKCKGPVVAGLLAVRETAVSKEPQVRLLPGVCLGCGNKQDRLPEAGTVRGFLPVEWGD